LPANNEHDFGLTSHDASPRSLSLLCSPCAAVQRRLCLTPAQRQPVRGHCPFLLLPLSPGTAQDRLIPFCVLRHHLSGHFVLAWAV